MERHPALREALAYAAAEAARQLSERIEGGTCIQLRQQDLADVLGLSRESVSRVLTSKDMRGRVSLGRGRIVLLGA